MRKLMKIKTKILQSELIEVQDLRTSLVNKSVRQLIKTSKNENNV